MTLRGRVDATSSAAISCTSAAWSTTRMAAFTELVDLAAGRLGGSSPAREASSSRRRRICSSRRSRSGVPTDIPTAASGWTAGSRAAGARRGMTVSHPPRHSGRHPRRRHRHELLYKGTSHRTVRSTAASLRRIPALRRSRQSRRRGPRCAAVSCGRQRELLRRRRRAPFHARAAEHFSGRRRAACGVTAIVPDWAAILPGAPDVNVSAIEHGGRHRLRRSVHSHPQNLLHAVSCGQHGRWMGDQAPRGPGHDWAILRLGIQAVIGASKSIQLISRTTIRTAVPLDAALVAGEPGRQCLGGSAARRLGPHAAQALRAAPRRTRLARAAQHVSRRRQPLRVFGTPTREGESAKDCGP